MSESAKVELAINRLTEKRDFFADLHDRLPQIPEREIERVRRVQQMEQSRLNTMHPPTSFRLQLLKTRQSTVPQITIDATTHKQVAAELAPLEPKIQQILVDSYLSRLY
ncbi:MAG: hypothetical protein AAF614_28680 [Chloroflexota bacterium]